MDHTTKGYRGALMSYEVEPKDRYFQTLCHLPEREIVPGPSVTFSSAVDLSQVMALRATASGGTGANRPDVAKPSITAFVVKAVAIALSEFGYANRRVFRRPWRPWRGPLVQRFDFQDVAVAAEVDMPGRQSVAFVDVLRDARFRSLADITSRLRAFGTRGAQSRQWHNFSALIEHLPFWLASLVIRLPVWFPSLWVRYRGAAALVTSPAKYGVERIAAVWAWPLGISFGQIKQHPVVKDGDVVVRPMFDLVVNFDRRIMAGAQAARFFARIVELLEHAATELGDASEKDQEEKGDKRTAAQSGRRYAVETSIEIDAPVEKVYDILADVDSYATWNPVVVHGAGKVVEGGRLRLRFRAPGLAPRDADVAVLSAVPNRRLRWLGKTLLPGLLDGDHAFTLIRLGPTKTRLVHSEVFTGLFTRIVGRHLVATMTKAFETMNNAIKHRAEAQTASMAEADRI